MVNVIRKALLVFIALLLVNGPVSAQALADKKITVLNVNEPLPQASTRIKRVSVGGDDPAAKYTYADIINELQDIAMRWDADLIKIEQHEVANSERCDKVVASLYDVNEHPDVPEGYPEGDFIWTRNRKLDWRDFQGRVPRLSHNDMTVAATYCGFGYEMSYKSNSKPVLSIKNRFYADKSWGMDEYRNAKVLEHEQAHFDLCEIYTRKFRELATKKLKTGTNYKKLVDAAYDQVYGEYERAQARYDSETDHGNNKEAQQRWKQQIEKQLQETDAWHEV